MKMLLHLWRVVGFVLVSVLVCMSSRESRATAALPEEAVIRTPKPPAPRINGAKVLGVRPGHPFLFTIPATGQRPMEFAVEGLPRGLTVDSQTGQITGSLKDRGQYVVTFHAKNTLGEAKRKFRIVCGDTLALTPHMGWNSWYGWANHVSDKVIRSAADAMISTGMINHGWTYVNIDDCWTVKEGSQDSMLSGSPRNASGNVNPNKHFPDMKALTDYIHGKGLKTGIYTSPGPLTCEGYVGAYQYEEQDARQFAAWGFDFLKYDWCSYARFVPDTLPRAGEAPNVAAFQKPYRQMGQILKTVDRDIVFSLDQNGRGSVWRWGREVGGHNWKTHPDLTTPRYDIAAGIFGTVFNLYGRNELQQYSGPGGWNDADYLQLGYVTTAKGTISPTPLSPNEQYTHMSLWCLLAAPLILGGDITRLDEFTLSLLTNDEVLEVDQDPLGKSALRVAKTGDIEVWAKDMEDGSKAVGLFNLGRSEAVITAKWPDLGLNGKQIVRDLWRQKDLGVFKDRFVASIGRRGVVLIRLRPTQ